MSQSVVLKAKGLYTHPSDIVAVPEGALSVADNIVIDREELIEPRRGFDQIGAAYTDTSLRARQLFEYQDKIISSVNDTASFPNSDVSVANDTITVATHTLVDGDIVHLSSSNNIPIGLVVGKRYFVVSATPNTFKVALTKGGSAIDITDIVGEPSDTHQLIYPTKSLCYFDSNAWTSYSGSYSPPDSKLIRTAQANENFYFTSSDGVYKLDAYANTPKISGVPQGLDAELSLSTGSTWLADGSTAAYRVLWGLKDANGNLIIGAPSQRSVLINGAGATRAVTLKIFVPDNITTAHFFQVYRNTIASNTTEPSDEMQLTFEGNATAVQLTSASATVLEGAWTDDGGDLLATITAQPFAVGDIVRFVADNTLPTGLSENTDYFVVEVATNTIKISATFGGTAVAWTDDGTGSNTIEYGKRIALDDITPDVLLGATLYTAASQEGAGSENFRPPVAKDIANYKDHTFYANTERAHEFTASLLGVGGTKGLVADDTITVDGIAYTAKATENISSAHFLITTGGSTSTNIRDTALSLVRVINQHASSTVYAYYVSTATDLPGQILFQARALGTDAFTTSSSIATAWSPDLTSGELSSSDAKTNKIYFSKINEPEAVPLARVFDVGSAASEITRIVPLRDSLFIFKTDGIYRVSGEDVGSFRVDLFDSTTKLICNDSIAVLNNQIWCMTDQGVVSISDGGIQVKSRPIENTLISLFNINQDVFVQGTFGVSYESERKYILFVPQEETDGFPTAAFVYNTFTNTWTRWVMTRQCGFVSTGEDKLYLGLPDSAYVHKERKNRNFTDYADFRQTGTMTANSGTSVTMSSITGIAVGDVIYQDEDKYSIVTAVNATTSVLTLLYDGYLDYTAGSGAVTIYAGIDTKVKWAPVTLGNPGATKQFREISMRFKQDFINEATVKFNTDDHLAQVPEVITGTGLGAQWGMFAWGENPWATGRKPDTFRMVVPRNAQRGTHLEVEFNHNVGYSNYQLDGLSIVANIISERIHG